MFLGDFYINKILFYSTNAVKIQINHLKTKSLRVVYSLITLKSHFSRGTVFDITFYYTIPSEQITVILLYSTISFHCATVPSKLILVNDSQ